MGQNGPAAAARAAVLLLLLLTACRPGAVSLDELTPQAAVADEERSGCQVIPPPAELGLNPFYEKYCDAGGIPVVSSGAVDDLALQQAYYIITNMLASLPNVREVLVEREAYFAIMGTHEMQTTLPEYSHMDSDYWDERARGLGGSYWDSLTSAAEENLLCLPSDRYFGESIAVHEFAHTIHKTGLMRTVQGFNAELNRLYDLAMDEGLWENTYAGSNRDEYWAEGVQDYFNTNLQARPTNGVHNYVNTRRELAEYDPRLFEFIDSIFGGFEWTPSCPRQ